ncbi:MAG TPA: hypothetical protein VII92_08295, partial [Anaerolineae bacterium]
MSKVVSKIAIHSVGGRRNGYGQFLQRINAAGRHLSLVKCRDDFGAIDEALALWPNMPTIGAFTELDGLPVNLGKFFERAAKNPRIDYWEILNEINGIYSEQANFYISIAPEFKRRGLGMALFSCASGTPIMPGESLSIVRRVVNAAREAFVALRNQRMTSRLQRQASAARSETPYEAIARACKYMIDNDVDAILSLHEYNSSGGTIGRYKVLADYLQGRGALLPIAITEFGFETHPSDAEFMRMIRANDPVYMGDDRVMGCAAWTLGGGGWQGSNYERALPQLG